MRSNNLYLFLIFVFILGCERNVSVPPPDQPPPNGHIFINSYPEGMQIFLERKDRRRKTPDSITWLESNEYEFTLKHPHFLDTSFYLLSIEGEKESIFVDYRKSKKMLATLALDSYPQKANIYLNDSLLIRKTPLVINNLLPGYYKVRYSFENHRETEHEVLLKSSETTHSFLPMLDLTTWEDFNHENSNLRSNNLSCIEKDRFNNIRIGSEDKGLYSFEGEEFRNYNSGNSGVLNNTINDIAFLSNNTMLLATSGMAIFAPPETTFGSNENYTWQYWVKGDTIVDMPDNLVTSVTVDDNDKFWFGTENGLVNIFLEEGFFVRRLFTSKNSPLPSNSISHLSWKYNELWVGTISSGLAVANTERHVLEWNIFTRPTSGLLTNNINSIFPIGPMNSYIGSSTHNDFSPGLAYFDNNSWDTKFFDMPDNNVLSVFQDSKGRVWVGTETSIIVFENWDDKKIYTYENTSLLIENISGFIEELNGNILITSDGGGLFRYLK